MRIISLFILLLSASSAISAETSQGQNLGFTVDGKYFAYEEFGISDGIGLPYSSIYVIDVEKDKWVNGTPVRSNLREGDEQTDDDSTTLKDWQIKELNWLTAVRGDIKAKAAPLMKRLGTFGFGLTRYQNSTWQHIETPHLARFSPISLRSSDGKFLKLEIEEMSFPATEKACYGFYQSQKGFSLRITDEKTGKSKNIANDTRVPNSRGCPQSYAIEQVIVQQTERSVFSIAVLIRYMKLGFEGKDGRLLAVTTKF